METFNRSYGLVKESFSVLRKDKEIMLFPIISGAVGIVLFAFMAISYFSLGLLGDAGNILSYPLLFLYYLASYFIVIFFNTGLVTCANIRMNGGDPKFSDGINNALKHVGKIFVWALISATVGIILRKLSERSGLLGRLVLGLIGMAWSLLTFFVIPVMIFENISVTDSIRKSGALFRKTWGENVVGQFSMGFFFFLLGIPGIIAMIIAFLFLFSGNAILGALMFGGAILYLLMLGIISSSLNGIFTTALYNYASNGAVPQGFSAETIKGAWKTKSR
jgi:hypothetical protein